MITFVIKTFKRKKLCERLVKSIRKYYDYPILIANDDGEELSIDGTTVYNLDFDVGLSAGRNFLIDKVNTPYFVLLDDDFIFTKKTDINKFLKLMEKTDFDIIGGALSNEGKGIAHYEGTYEVSHRVLKYIDKPIRTDEIIPEYSFVFNFFIGRTSVFQDGVRWDDNLKLAEHTAFFYDHLGKIKVGYCEDVVVVHKQERIGDYPAYRSRGKIFLNDFLISRNLRAIKGFTSTFTAKMEDINDQINDVDFLITTFMRKESLEKLLFSIVEFYPQAKIFIADQNERFDAKYYRELWEQLFEKGLINKPVAYGLKYDIGLSECRNYLIRNTTSPYKLILEDDFIFTEKTDIYKFIDVLDNDLDIGIIGGATRKDGELQHFEFNIERDGNIIRQIEDGDNWYEIKGIKVKKVECVLNFALIRTNVLDQIKWDPELKNTEHLDFFIRLKSIGCGVAYTPDVIMEHDNDDTEEYKELRNRKEFLAMMMKRHNINKIEYLNGSYYELKDGKVRHLK